MNKILKILILAIVYFSVNSSLCASNYKLVLDNNPSQIINSIQLNKADYAPIDNIANKIFKNKNYVLVGNIINFNNYKLKFIPNSLFAMLSKGDSVLITQMQLPSILYQNKLYLPINTFINSLDSLGIFSVDESNNSFVLLSKVETIKKPKNDIVYMSIPKLKMDVKKITDKKYNAMNEISDSYSKLYSSLKKSFNTSNKNKKASPKKKFEIINEEEHTQNSKYSKKAEEFNDFYHLPKGLVRTEIESILKDTDSKTD